MTATHVTRRRLVKINQLPVRERSENVPQVLLVDAESGDQLLLRTGLKCQLTRNAPLDGCLKRLDRHL